MSEWQEDVVTCTESFTHLDSFSKKTDIDITCLTLWFIIPYSLRKLHSQLLFKDAFAFCQAAYAVFLDAYAAVCMT